MSSKHLKFLGIIAAYFLIMACGKSESSDLRVDILTASDGARCYVIMQNGEARGGGCK